MKTGYRVPKRYIARALLIAAMFALIEVLVGQLGSALRAETERRLVGEASDARAILEAQISEGIYITIGLESFIASRGGELPLDDMRLWMANLFENTRHLRNIGIAPNNRITAVFPIAGNESVLGLDYRDLPAQWPAIERMMQTGQSSLVGPVTLVQGGSGLIYRRPVFTGGNYWGLISTVMIVDSIWEALENATNENASFIRIEALANSGRTPVAGKLSPAPRASASLLMDLPGNTQWELTISEQRALWPVWTARLVLWALGLLILLYAWQKNQARRIEQRSTREKVDFIHTISHELRTPLTSISGALALIERESGATPTATRLLELATRNAKRLDRLVSEVLDIARLDSARMSFSMMTLPIGPLTTQAMENNQPFATERGVEICHHLEPELVNLCVYVDEQRILQIFDNLLSNAIKFSDIGDKVELAVTLRKGKLYFSVKDEGIGIPAQFQDRLFERFARADHSDNRRNQTGTGLGLSITRDLVIQMGGDIKAWSEEGKGSEFTVEFPVVTP